MPSIPFALQCTIPESQLLYSKNFPDKRLFSVILKNIPGVEYYLGVRPNGQTEKHREQTWMFLHVDFENIKNVEADYTLVIESADFSKIGNYIYEHSKGRGFYVCKTEEFFDPEKKFIVDGKCVVKVYGVIKYENDVNSTGIDQQKWNGGEIGSELWKKDDTKDFTIVVDGDKKIKVHKFILAIRSDVFAAMLKSNMKEAEENKMVITDFTYNVVEVAMKLIYHCNFDASLSLDELMLLQQFLDKYNIASLKAKVEPFLIDQISASTVVRLTNCSVLPNSFELKEKCMEILSTSFASKTPLHDIKILDKDILLKIVEDSLYQIVETEK